MRPPLSILEALVHDECLLGDSRLVERCHQIIPTHRSGVECQTGWLISTSEPFRRDLRRLSSPASMFMEIGKIVRLRRLHPTGIALACFSKYANTKLCTVHRLCALISTYYSAVAMKPCPSSPTAYPRRRPGSSDAAAPLGSRLRSGTAYRDPVRGPSCLRRAGPDPSAERLGSRLVMKSV